jgi:hypothetical protein
MGALVSRDQRDNVREQVDKLVTAARGSCRGVLEASVGPEGGAFMDPILLRADDPWTASAVHDMKRSARSRPSCLTATLPKPSHLPIADGQPVPLAVQLLP